jgi:hypothetical protein
MPAPFLPLAWCADYNQITQNAFARNNLENPPIVKEERQTHWLFKGKAGRKPNAVAVRTKDGREWIVINTDSTLGDCKADIEHEIGHLLTWRRYGTDVPEHGNAFRQTCREIATDPRKTCR